MWQSIMITPEAGTRIVAPYNDGSGAQMFLVVDGEDGSLVLIDEDGDEYGEDHLSCESFSHWAALPEGMKLWCELRSEEPISVSF